METCLDEWIKADPAFYELVWGAWTTFLCLHFGCEYFLRTFPNNGALSGARVATIHLAGSSAFLVNHYLGNAPFYFPLLLTYSAVFFALWAALLSAPFQSPWVRALFTLLGAAYTVLYIVNENIARLLVRGVWFNTQVVSGCVVPEVLLQAVSVCAIFALIQRFSATGTDPNRRSACEMI
mmetsp:Transcript_8452/g.21342  ORF Transcript_8452/g.21342 Transcript_8452/m.21342 type:complete len:180 (+) Transcript_8452:38-577(+)